MVITTLPDATIEFTTTVCRDVGSYTLSEPTTSPATFAVNSR